MAPSKNTKKIDIFILTGPREGHFLEKNMFQKGLKMTLRWLGLPFNFMNKSAQNQYFGSWSAFHFNICLRMFLKNL